MDAVKPVDAPKPDEPKPQLHITPDHTAKAFDLWPSLKAELEQFAAVKTPPEPWKGTPEQWSAHVLDVVCTMVPTIVSMSEAHVVDPKAKDPVKADPFAPPAETASEKPTSFGH